jgi:hypothetical protein
VSSDIEVFVECHQGPNHVNPDPLYSPSATDALVSYYHFLISCTIVLSLTCIFVVFARINMAKMVKLDGEVEWRKQDIDPMALYTSRGGKRQGW